MTVIRPKVGLDCSNAPLVDKADAFKRSCSRTPNLLGNASICPRERIVNAGTPMQVWRCQLNDNVSEEEVMARAVEWKAAATKVPGGEGLSQSVMFPVASGADGLGTDILYTVQWKSFSHFGEWWDNYNDSDAAALEGQTMTCHGSGLWEREEG